MNSSSLQPKPWLDLFQTDFHRLRRQQEYLLNSVPTEPRNSISEETPTEDVTTDSSTDTKPETDPSTDLFSLPDEVFQAILLLLEAEQLSTLAQVSKKFLPFVYDPRLWRRIASVTWPNEHPSQLEQKLYIWKTWRKLCILRPRLRTNAIYVFRHQFAKTATKLASEEPVAPVFLITYYRFLRFYNDGTVVSLTTSELPHLAVQRVRRVWRPGPGERDKVTPSIGRFDFDEASSRVVVSLPISHSRFPHMCSGTMYMHLLLSSTKPGAFDRLHLTDHYAIMDHEGGDLVSYHVESSRKPFCLVPIWGFRSLVYKEFPRDDDRDLAQWFEMKKAARAFRHRIAPS